MTFIITKPQFTIIVSISVKYIFREGIEVTSFMLVSKSDRTCTKGTIIIQHDTWQQKYHKNAYQHCVAPHLIPWLYFWTQIWWQFDGHVSCASNIVTKQFSVCYHKLVWIAWVVMKSCSDCSHRSPNMTPFFILNHMSVSKEISSLSTVKCAGKTHFWMYLWPANVAHWFFS